MQKKFEFYEKHGVEEYYIYDPEDLVLQGWQRQGKKLKPIRKMDQWVSPRLKIRFAWKPKQEMALYYPDGRRFLTFQEVSEQAKLAQQQAELAQQEAEQERFQKELAQQQELAARQRAEQLAEYLRSLGIDPDQIPDQK